MIITDETSLKDFEFWGQARENFNKLTDEEIAYLDDYLDGSVCNRTQVNDMFAYYFDSVCSILDLDMDEVIMRK